MPKKKAIAEIKHGGVQSLARKADQLGIKVDIIPGEHKLVKFRLHNKVVLFRIGTIPLQKRMGNMTTNKNLTKNVLRTIGVNTPTGIMASSFKEALGLIKKNRLSYPLIVKPIDGSLASGVTWNIQTKNELRKAINLLSKNKSSLNAKKFLVEEMFIGDEYRILIFNKKVLSCVKKIPASLIGDGRSSIRQLLDKFNKTRKKGFEIKLDAVTLNTIKTQKLTLDCVLADNFVLKLRNNLNMSDGGRCVESTRDLCPFFKEICENSAAIVGLSFCGIDFMCHNISDMKSPYTILEINPNPFYNMHEKPLVEGRAIDVSERILRSLFPELKKKAKN